MPLLFQLIFYFLIKGFFLWPFYYSKKWKPLWVGFTSSMMTVPLMVMLYHETDLSFWYVYLGLIVLDTLLYCFLLKSNWWKAIPISLVLNTIAIVFFFICNG